MSASINNAKRAEMAAVVSELLANGATINGLADALKVTAGSIRRYRDGKSTGTNAQRAQLRVWLERQRAAAGVQL